MDTKPPFRLNTGYFRSPNNPRLWFWSLLLRIALWMGHPVVLVGVCRSGKTLLLNKLTPGKVIAPSGKVIDRYSVRDIQHWAVSERDIPAGLFSLDECQALIPALAGNLMLAMAVKRRAFCLAAQNYRDVHGMVAAYHSTRKGKRMLLVVVGGKCNPPSFILNPS